MADRSFTINDVARLAQVSNATVSRYLNKTAVVNEEKSKKIEQAIKQLGFRINRTARMLKTDCSQQIMMIVPDIENPFYSVAYKVIQDIALQEDYVVTLYNTNSIEKNEMNAINLAHELNIDGLIFCSTYDYPKVYEELLKFNKPIVASNSFGTFKFDTVHSIKGQGLYTTAKYLIELGHKKIAYAGGEKSSIINIRRFDGFKRALNEAGIDIKDDYVFHSNYNMEGGYNAAKYFMAQKEPPTAIACANDLLAMGVIQAIIGSGKKVPEDFSVTGMDNIEYAELSMPPITTVTNNSREFAQKCMSLLISRLKNEYNGSPREFLTTRQLIVRESTKEFNA